MGIVILLFRLKMISSSLILVFLVWPFLAKPPTLLMSFISAVSVFVFYYYYYYYYFFLVIAHISDPYINVGTAIALENFIYSSFLVL
jgi:hypothetical protein